MADPLSNKSSNAKRSSILKRNSSPQELITEGPPHSTKNARFNEENIKETYRPADKDYGFDKITQPKTPYEREEAPIDANKLKKRLKLIADNESKNNDEQQASCSSSYAGGSISSEASSSGSKKSKVSASISVTSGDSISFEAKRHNHYRAEFKVAKQAVVEELTEQSYNPSREEI